MLNALTQWWRRRIVQRHPIDNRLWQRVMDELPLLRGLATEERIRLRYWTTLLLHRKSIYGVQGLEVDEHMKLVVAAQAALLILNLDLDYYRGWSSIVLYPGGFLSRHEERDEAGVVHLEEDERIGESWQRGPVILSWEDARPGAHPFGSGSNVVIHEFAHKLDMLTGDPNGLPPLHPGMRVDAWSRSFSAAYEDLERRLERGEEPPVDPYAAENPGEFFAVFSELFFELPGLLKAHYPEVYEQLRQFYRQDPAARTGGRH